MGLLSCSKHGPLPKLLSLLAQFCRLIPGLPVHACDMVGFRALTGLMVIGRNKCCPFSIPRVAWSTPSLLAIILMSWKSLPGHRSWSKRNQPGDALSPGPMGGCESPSPLASPPPPLLPSASEVLALLLMALEAGWEVAQEAHGGRYGACGTDWDWWRAGVHLKRGRWGSHRREKGGQGGGPGLDGRGICSCSQRHRFGISLGGLSAMFRPAPPPF